MYLTSTSFQKNQALPIEFTCDGIGHNPPLTISEIPAGAKSLVLIVDDPDAPSGDFVHWTVWNINPNTNEIKANSVPNNAVEGLTDYGHAGYGAPCPPHGIHRYQFKLYALDTILDLTPNTRKKDLELAIKEHTLDNALLVGLYKKLKTNNLLPNIPAD